ncbi:MAG: hypothetical protein ACI9S8_002977 [Chlamydiales bacterium]|jgi:hypothetical protein
MHFDRNDHKSQRNMPWYIYQMEVKRNQEKARVETPVPKQSQHFETQRGNVFNGRRFSSLSSTSYWGMTFLVSMLLAGLSCVQGVPVPYDPQNVPAGSEATGEIGEQGGILSGFNPFVENMFLDEENDLPLNKMQLEGEVEQVGITRNLLSNSSLDSLEDLEQRVDHLEGLMELTIELYSSNDESIEQLEFVHNLMRDSINELREDFEDHEDEEIFEEAETYLALSVALIGGGYALSQGVLEKAIYPWKRRRFSKMIKQSLSDTMRQLRGDLSETIKIQITGKYKEIKESVDNYLEDARPTTAFKRLMLEAVSLEKKVIFLNKVDRRLKNLVRAIQNSTSLNEKDKKKHLKELKILKKTFYGLLDTDIGAEEEFLSHLDMVQFKVRLFLSL